MRFKKNKKPVRKVQFIISTNDEYINFAVRKLSAANKRSNNTQEIIDIVDGLHLYVHRSL